MTSESLFYATGKRKRATARTWLTPGTGQITINNLALKDYFTIQSLETTAMQPFMLTNTQGEYDVTVRVHGGGPSGQAGAVRHGITGALIQANPDLRRLLKKAGFVRRDPRQKERKKYGQRGARARFQFSKR